MMDANPTDPKGLIRESYCIDGITPGECRSIFLDWVLSLPLGADIRAVIPQVLGQYEQANPGHPMNTVLHDGLAAGPKSGRRGGRAARFEGKS